MQDLKKSVLEEFDEKFPLVECSAHERTSSAGCICEELPDINEEAIEIRNFISTAIDKSFEAGRQQAIDDVLEFVKTDIENNGFKTPL